MALAVIGDSVRKFMFAISSLDPVAQPIVLQAAQVYFKHLHPWLVCLLIHGSAYKGGFIPGCSDIDLQLYLDEKTFVGENELALELTIAMQRDLAQIDIAPFQYLQTYVFPTDLRIHQARGWVGPIAGAYQILYGALPIPEATVEQVLEQSHLILQRVSDSIAEVKENLLMGGRETFSRSLRLFCTTIWPTLYSVLTLRSTEPLDVWRLPKGAAVAFVPESEATGKAIRNFYHSLVSYYASGQQSIEMAFQMIRDGVQFFQAVEEWYGSRRQ